jgi:hypothetical protein
VSLITQELLSRENEVREYVEKYADLFDLDPNLVRGLITQESRFLAEAVSSTGAYGYGQFTYIGGKQVQNISKMTEKAADLSGFTKWDADQPDVGIKAICATLWWLFNKKYPHIQDKKIQLEAVLTFYNAGGRPAALIIKHGGHKEALPHLKRLPKNLRSQSTKYAPEVAIWFVAWYEHMQKEAAEAEAGREEVATTAVNPFDEAAPSMDAKYRALVEALLLLNKVDDSVDSMVSVRDGLTEVSLIFPGEYE